MKKILLIIMGFGIVGCATSPSLSLKGQYVNQIEDEGTRIFITRNTGFRGSAVAFTISMDDINYFRLRQGETDVLEEPKLGKRKICNLMADIIILESCIDVVVEKGDKLFYETRYKSALGSEIIFVQQTKEEFLSN